MNWRVQFAPEALDQLRSLEKRIANIGAPITAERYVDSIVDFCAKLQHSPHGVSHAMICCPDFASLISASEPSSRIRWTRRSSRWLVSSTAAKITKRRSILMRSNEAAC